MSVRVGLLRYKVSTPRRIAREPGYRSPDPAAEWNRRYVEGNRLYFREAGPHRYAGVIVDSNLNDPFFLTSWNAEG